MNDEEMAHYSAALDEIWRLRQALAYEAAVLEGHTAYKTFPKSRSALAVGQVTRMRISARGDAAAAYAGIGSEALRQTREASDMGLLTRWQWENDRPAVRSDAVKRNSWRTHGATAEAGEAVDL